MGNAGKVDQVPVQVGDGGDDFRAVESGLRSGDRIVVYPGDTLRSGDAVKTKWRRRFRLLSCQAVQEVTAGLV